MKLNYEENEILMFDYISKCRKEIKNTVFSDDSKQNKEIQKEKNEMINIIFNHTMRLVKDASKISKKMNLPVDFIKLVKTSSLLNDIARFKQAIWSLSFKDEECKEFEGASHAEYGYEMLFIRNEFQKFNIPQNYEYAIGQAVRYHQASDIPNNLKKQFTSENQLNPNLLTGYAHLNENEKVIVSTLVQIVRDANMLTNLWTHTTNEFCSVPKFITYSFVNDSLSDISKRFGIPKSEIISYNHLKSNDIKGLNYIKIPVKNIKPEKLSIPNDIKDKFFKNEDLDLNEIQNRRDYNFIVGMLWELNYFLNNLKFVSSLERIEEKRILEKMYDKYPSEYKFLVKDAFEFAQEQLVEKRLNDNENKTYIKRY